MVGTAEYQVELVSDCCCQKELAENLPGTTTVPPELRVDRHAPMSPWTWKSGITISDVSSGVRA